MKLLLLPFLWPIYTLLFISTAFPTPVGNFDFMHVSEENSLTLTISKNSPPIAALMDENLPELKVEPAQPMKIEKNARVLAAGRSSAWPNLQKVAIKFEKAEKIRIKRHQLNISRAEKSEVVENPREVRLQPTRISELIHLVEPVKTADAVTQFVQVPVYAIPPERKPVTPAKPAAGTSYAAAPKAAQDGPMVDGSKSKAQSKKNEGSFIIEGQVELTGGLASVKGANQLSVQWKTGLDAIDADLDLGTGKFAARVPNLSAGKIIAQLVDNKNKVLGRGDFDLDGVAAPGQTILEGIKIIVDPIETNTRGEVFSAYSYDEVRIPVAGAEVFAPSQIRERVDSQGRYKISGLGAGSTFVLDAYAPEHWGTRIITETQTMERVPLFSDKMMQSLFNIMEEPLNTDYGVIWGEVKRKKKSVEGVTVSIGTPGVIGPIYFNELRIPDKNLKKTSSNGLFAFLRVPPGLNTITTQKEGFELPSRVVASGPGLVSYSLINLKSLTLQGRVVDPLLKQNTAAQIAIVGTQIAANAGDQGFSVKIPSTDSVLYLDAKAGDDYLISRVAVPRSQAKEINIPVIKKQWLAEAMNKAQIKNGDGKGMLLGMVVGPEFRVSFESEKISDDQIYYFEDKETFLVYNLEPGLHTAVLTSADGQVVNSHVFVSQGGILNIINSDLRP